MEHVLKPLPKISKNEVKNYIHHGEFLMSLAKFIRAKVIVEIGVQDGRTARDLVLAARKTKGEYFGYDLFAPAEDGPYSHSSYGTKSKAIAQIKKGLKKYYSTPRWNLCSINTQTEEFVKKLESDLSGRKIDLAFIDGCHSYDGALNDYKNISKHMSQTGVIVFHDTYSHVGLRKLALDLRTKFYDGTYDVVDFPFGGYGRVGLTLIVKRSFALSGTGITNYDHDKDMNAEDIYLAENSYLEKEKK